jgi:uncharacterized membrane protein YbhN (UPF0104 family)
MRQFALIAVKFSISAALFYFAVSRIDLGSFSERLTRVELPWLALALAVGFVQLGLVAVRWQRIALACDASLSLRQALRFNLIGAFFNQVLPSTVGGDAVRIWLFGRAGAGWRAASYSVLIDRFFGMLALAVIVAAGFYWSLALIGNPTGRVVLAVIGLGSLGGAAAFLAFGSWPVLARWKVTQPISDMAGICRGLLLTRDAAAMITATSVLIHLLTAVMAWSVARAVAARLGYGDAVLLVLPAMLIAVVPVSIAGWGVRESALVLAFSYGGLAEADGLAVSVLLGLVMFGLGVIGGIVWLVNPGNLRLSQAWTAEPPPSATPRS